MENGYSLTYSYLESCSFDKPILVKNVQGLGMILPEPTTSVEDIAQLIGTTKTF